jgi:magnesium transporter
MVTNQLDLKNTLNNIDEDKILGLRQTLDEFYPQDIAEAYNNLNEEEGQTLFDVLSFQQGALVIIELEDYQIKDLFEYLSNEKIARFVNELELDDAADLLGLLDDEDRTLNIMDRLNRPYEIQELLSFDPDSAGGMMNPDFISIRADLKVAAALRFLRIKAKNTDSQIVYMYVTTKTGELKGVISLKELFMAKDDSFVADYVNEDVIYVQAHQDREEVAEIISKYHFLALPVVDEKKVLVGVIAINDVVEILEDEVTQDIYQASGINVEEDAVYGTFDFKQIFAAYKSRTPWLVITLFGQALSASLLLNYNDVISAVPVAVSFMPLLSGLSGNIGNQSTTIMIRGIYTGEINIGKSLEVLISEFATSIGIGFTCALITAAVSYFMNHNLLLSLLIAISLVVSMIAAVLLGTMVPIFFKKANFDPATASGPLITTLIDIISFIVYLSLVRMFLLKLT